MIAISSVHHGIPAVEYFFAVVMGDDSTCFVAGSTTTEETHSEKKWETWPRRLQTCLDNPQDREASASRWLWKQPAVAKCDTMLFSRSFIVPVYRSPVIPCAEAIASRVAREGLARTENSLLVSAILVWKIWGWVYQDLGRGAINHLSTVDWIWQRT